MSCRFRVIRSVNSFGRQCSSGEGVPASGYRTRVHLTRMFGMLILMAGLVFVFVGNTLWGRIELTVLGIIIAVVGGYFYFYRGMIWVDLDDI